MYLLYIFLGIIAGCFFLLAGINIYLDNQALIVRYKHANGLYTDR